MKRPPLTSFILFALVSTGLQAQFNLNKLSDGLSKAKQVGDTATSKAKTATQLAKGVAGIGPEEERVIGGSVATDIINTYGGLDRDEAESTRLNLVGKSLARYSSRPGLDWRFSLLNSETVNAFSAPSGYVFITKGLYAQLADDDALAAILSHEIAHITEKHALKIVARGEFISGASAVVTEYSSNAQALESQLRQFDVGIEEITKTLFEKGFDPQTEYEADRKGHDLAALTGYAPGGLRAVLLKLKSTPGMDAKKVFPTHPSFDNRLKQLPADPAPLPAPAPGKP